MGYVAATEDNKRTIEMIIGHIVKPSDGRDPLHCGSGFYPDAVVVALDPLILVSRSTEMKWESTIQDRKFEVIETASNEQLKRCQRRIT